MFKTTKRYLSIMSIILILCFVSVIFAGCGGGGNSNTSNDNPAGTDNANQNTEVSETPAETTLERVSADLPEMDFGGYEFRILSRGLTYNVHWFAKDIYAEAETGDPINDAVFIRNKTVEDKYNIKIVDYPENGDLTPRATKVIKAGDDAFDIIAHGLASVQTLMADGYLYDLTKFPYIDLSKPWWDQKAVEQLSFDNKYFSAVTNYLTTDKDATWIIMFNKKVLQDNSLEDPYQLVKNGKWTMDKMLEMMKTVAKDLNGDGQMDDTDQWGLVSQYKNAEDLYSASGEYIAKIDPATKLPVLTMFNQRAIDVCEKILSLQSDKLLTINADDYLTKYPNDTVWDDMQLVVFNTNRSLFYFAGMNRVTLLRDMETDFGIIPAPKFDEQQENYYPAVDMWCMSSVAIPVTIAEKDRTGIILEALAAESQYTLLPAYYDISLKTKFARDDESQEMLDLIFANRLYDIGKVFNWGTAGSFFTTLNKGTNTLASYWEKNEAKITTAMNKTIDKITSIEQ